MQHGGNLFHVVVAGFGVNHYAIMSAAFVEIGFLKCSDLDRRIDQPVIIFRAESALGHEVSGVAMRHPSGTWLKRTTIGSFRASTGYIRTCARLKNA